MQGAIFNINNLIVDTNQQQFAAWRQLAMYEFGLGLPGKLAPQLNNLRTEDALPIVLKQLHQTVDEAEQVHLLTEHTQMYEQVLNELKPDAILPGIERLLINLDDHDVQMAIIDSDGQAELILKQLQIADYFTTILKPTTANPYLELAQTIAIKPTDMISFATNTSDVDLIKQTQMVAIGIGDETELTKADYVVVQTGDLRYPMIRKTWEDCHD